MAQALPYQSRLSLRTSYTSEPRHRLVEFGDGYIQRTPWGPYPGRRSMDVVHEHLTQTEADDLITFYETRHDDADCISINDNALTHLAGKYYLQSYSVEMTNTDKRTVSARMIEVFGE